MSANSIVSGTIAGSAFSQCKQDQVPQDIPAVQVATKSLEGAVENLADAVTSLEGRLSTYTRQIPQAEVANKLPQCSESEYHARIITLTDRVKSATGRLHTLLSLLTV